MRTGHGELREFQAAYISGLSDVSERSELQIRPYDLDADVNLGRPVEPAAGRQ